VTVFNIAAARWHGVFRPAALAWFCLLAASAMAPASLAQAEESLWVDFFGATYTAAAGDGVAEADPMASGPLFAVVSIADQKIDIYNDAGLAAQSPVSTGMPGFSTPTGVFSILQKRRWHRSNIYSGAPMPMMQRLTWSGIALHAGHIPGYPASHGCIRLPAGFAERLFRSTQIGYRVIIAPRRTAPVPVAHAALPSPIFQPAPGVAADKDGKTASFGSIRANHGVHLERVGFTAAPAEEALLNPLDYARALKTEANRQARLAARTLTASLKLSAMKAEAARIAARTLTRAEEAVEDAERDLKAAARRLEKAMDEASVSGAAKETAEAEASMTEALAKAEALAAGAERAMAIAEADWLAAGKAANERWILRKSEARAKAEAALTETLEAADAILYKAGETLAEAEAELAEARRERQDRIAETSRIKSTAEAALEEARKCAEAARAARDTAAAELSAARKAAAEAKAAGKAATVTMEEAARRQKPLSVFISRKTGKLHVRQNLDRVFDAPVVIRDADREIGTHVFMATGTALDGKSLRWQAVSMPQPAAPSLKAARKAGKEGAEAGLSAPVPAPTPETAQGALDRIAIPEDAARRLNQLAWIGATVIVSDQGISGETGDTTDFIILTRSR
jgi:hypothetical protein